MHVGTEQVATGAAKLRKYVVTDNVTQTVPVSREEVRLEREPITDANRAAALSGGDITEEEHEVTLNEERAVVSKEAVPVERVKLGTETVTGRQQVDDEVRKERIELDDSDVPAGRNSRKRCSFRTSWPRPPRGGGHVDRLIPLGGVAWKRLQHFPIVFERP